VMPAGVLKSVCYVISSVENYYVVIVLNNCYYSCYESVE